MHILQLTPQFPFPPDSGGRVGIFNSLKYLSRRHSITLLSFVTGETGHYVSNLEPYCDRIVTVRHPTGSSIPGMLKNVVSPRPYTIDKFAAAEMAKQVRQCTEAGQVDLVHIDHLHMAQYVHALPPGLPVILREHNVESVIMRRFAAQASNPFVKAYTSLQAHRLHRYEAGICPRFDRCVTVTGVDGRTLQQMAPGARVEVIPSGVDTEQFYPAVFPVEPETYRLVTTGDYSWAPTAAGLEYFVREVYPHIRLVIPEMRLSVVGRQPPASVARMTQENGIDILGRVDDVRPEILRGSVFVVPTRIGSGIRLKILEAMALHRPVVSTSIGCEGIEALPDEHILVADEPRAFAASVVRLLRDREQANRLATAAARLIEQRYAWPSIESQFDDLYRTVRDERS